MMPYPFEDTFALSIVTKLTGADSSSLDYLTTCLKDVTPLSYLLLALFAP